MLSRQEISLRPIRERKEVNMLHVDGVSKINSPQFMYTLGSSFDFPKRSEIGQIARDILLFISRAWQNDVCWSVFKSQVPPTYIYMWIRD